MPGYVPDQSIVSADSTQERDEAVEGEVVALVVVRPQAREDLKAAFSYIAQDNLEVATRFVEAARASLEALAAMPGAGSPCGLSDARLRDVRRWPISGFRKYLVFYRPLHDPQGQVEDGIEVLRVLHGARDVRLLLELDGPDDS